MVGEKTFRILEKKPNSEAFIQIPNTEILISKCKPEEFKGLNWHEAHEKLNFYGLFMPTPALFMQYVDAVISAYNQSMSIYDGKGFSIDGDERKRIYFHLTGDPNRGAWTWLDACFEEQKDGLYVLTKNRAQSLITKEKLGKCVDERCYVDFKCNSQGFPTRRSRSRSYEHGKKMHYRPPKDGKVAWFCARSEGADFNCQVPPKFSTAALGVFACGMRGSRAFF